MPQPNPFPILPTAGQAWRLFWRHRLLHAKAIWPPVLFLVAAEFLYHRIFGNAQGLPGRWHALLAAPWYMPVAAVVCWLAGLKFLLSFSISWRRHLLLRERFDPFFFKAPFWRYLGFLLLTYLWLLLLSWLAIMLGAPLVAIVSHGTGPGRAALAVSAVPMLAALGFALWAIARQAPFFTALTQDPPRPGWRESVAAMRGQALRYLGCFVLTMLPIFLLNTGLDVLLGLLHADRHAVPVALGESAFRQAMLFVHFSLGASIGALLFLDRFGSMPGEIASGR